MSTITLEHIKEEDVRTLLRHPDPERRAQAGQRICHRVRSAELGEGEKKFARKLLKIMSEDAVAIVRRTLAVTLRNSPELPHDIAVHLIADIDNIAIPVLLNSPVLTDEDLVDVLRSKAAAKVIAIAKRARVSGTIVREIVRYGDSRAVAEVAANDGAIIDERLAGDMLEIYHDDDLIKEAFIARRDLPIRVMEKLITMVSEEAALLMNRRHDIPVHVAVDIASRARERATLDITDENMREKDMQLFVQRLSDEGRLVPSLIIRMAGLGKMVLLKHALSQISGISTAKTALMIHDGGPFGLKALCERSGLTPSQTKLIRAACAIFKDLEGSGTDYDHHHFQTLMVQRMLTLPIELAEEEQNWFLERLDSLEDKVA